MLSTGYTDENDPSILLRTSFYKFTTGGTETSEKKIIYIKNKKIFTTKFAKKHEENFYTAKSPRLQRFPRYQRLWGQT